MLNKLTAVERRTGYVVKTLVRRYVKDDQKSRLSVYQRHDGLFQYTEEEMSEWDDAPPAWVEANNSGIFPTVQEAVLEARTAFSWLRPSDFDDVRGQPADYVQTNWRPLGTREAAVMVWLLRVEFEGRDALVAQLQTAMVKRIDRNGSLQFCIEGGPPALVAQRIAIEGFYLDDVGGHGPLVHLLIHVVGERLHELEIYKEDGSPILIDPYEIDISKIHYY